jgi:hypothetical protein
MTSPDIHRPLAHRVWDLLDQRPPQAIQALLERATDAVFEPVEGASASLRAASFVLGRVRFRLAMDFVAVLQRGLHYRVEATADFEAGAKDHTPPDAERRSAETWIDLWTIGLHSRPRPPVAGQSFVQRHAEMLAAWRAEEASLADVAATQQAILRALRHGQTFSIAHEEGGTRIRAAVRGFVSEDHGESIHVRGFTDDADFLDHLRQLYHWEISRLTWLEPVPEAHAWRLIYRQLMLDSAWPQSARADN